MSVLAVEALNVADRAPAVAKPQGLPAGYRLREFRIERTLGEGGFGVVYEATDLKLQRRVAIKEYMPAMFATRDADYAVRPLSAQKIRTTFGIGLRSFINEARLLARFEHPALVKVYQFWLDRGTGYMVMPLHTAPTLKDWLRERTEPPTQAWLTTFLVATIDAVELLHREQCLHRDISPDNILVLDKGQPLLLDFGAAREVVQRESQGLTVIYKPGFAPIEQQAASTGLAQGAWTDIYSLCAVAYFVITRRAPPPSVARTVNDSHRWLRDCAAGRYADHFLAALDAGLAVLPAQRPQSLAELRQALLGATAAAAAPVDAVAPIAPLTPAAVATPLATGVPLPLPTTTTPPLVRQAGVPTQPGVCTRPVALASWPPLPGPPPPPVPTRAPPRAVPCALATQIASSSDLLKRNPVARRPGGLRRRLRAFAAGFSVSLAVALATLSLLPHAAPRGIERGPSVRDVRPITVAPLAAAPERALLAARP